MVVGSLFLRGEEVAVARGYDRKVQEALGLQKLLTASASRVLPIYARLLWRQGCATAPRLNHAYSLILVHEST